MRIGYGFDSHAFQAGIPLIIGGLAIEHKEGLAGHSDGDVLLHAITDALLGAVSAGDIGTFFPPNDPRWKGAASSVFLQTALEEVATAGYRIVNIDTVLIMAQPKIAPIAGELRERVAQLLGVKPGEVGIKAKTPEGWDWTIRSWRIAPFCWRACPRRRRWARWLRPPRLGPRKN